MFFNQITNRVSGILTGSKVAALSPLILACLVLLTAKEADNHAQVDLFKADYVPTFA